MLNVSGPWHARGFIQKKTNKVDFLSTFLPSGAPTLKTSRDKSCLEDLEIANETQ
jgi:hypothetical protein